MAGGRYAANSLGGNAKLLAGNVLHSDKLKRSGRATLTNRDKKMRQRMNYTMQEVSGRFRQGGIFDPGGEYKGTTAHQLYSKDIEKERNLRYEGRKERSEMDEKWQSGDRFKSIIDAASLTSPVTGSAYTKWSDAFDGINKRAYDLVYGSEEFINAKMKFDEASRNADEVREKYQQAQSQGYLDATHAITINFADGSSKTYDGTTGKTLADLTHLYETQNKIKTGTEANLATMRKIYQSDAKTEEQIKYRKNNDTNPVT